jgi:hypothetical protein
MPAYRDKLTDQAIAAVASYIRNAWGNAAPPVDAEHVWRERGTRGEWWGIAYGNGRPQNPVARMSAERHAGPPPDVASGRAFARPLADPGYAWRP